MNFSQHLLLKCKMNINLTSLRRTLYPTTREKFIENHICYENSFHFFLKGGGRGISAITIMVKNYML